MPIPKVFHRESTSLYKLRKVWVDIYKSRLYQFIRHSKLNPYRWGLKTFNADSLEKAKEEARKNNKMRFIYNNEVYSSEQDCPVFQELEKEPEIKKGLKPLFRGSDKHPDVRNNIPRNEKGELDLFTEEPIIIAIVPVTGPSLLGHACLEYDGHVMNRLSSAVHTDPIPEKYMEYAEYFFVYPSKLGIKPHDIIRTIDKHNIKKIDKEYNFWTNSCASNVGEVLKNLGVKDLDFLGFDKIGMVFKSPGNNPFNSGIKAWCRKHGVHVTLEDVVKLRAGKKYPDNKAYRAHVREVGKRYYNR